MSREVKFKAWDNKKKKFLAQSNFAVLGNGKIVVTESGYFNHFHNTNPSDFILVRSTGMTDLNGNEIYEGDILHKDRYTDWEVVYEPPSFMVRNVSNYPLYQMDKHSCLDREIIGNIFENPELLK